MPRERICRAKATSGDWVYGYYRHVKLKYSDGSVYERHKIYELATGIEYDVEEETVGDYIGLTDCEDEKIYEKDAVIDLATETLYIVEWGEAEAGFYLFEVGGSRTFYFRDDSKSYKRIGNIHDNPELLEGK